MKKITCLLALFLAASVGNSFAQFEGKITYSLYEMNDSGDREEEEHLTAFITPERILLQTEESMSMAGSFETQGLLIRLDKKDFVFLTGNKTAMSITKAGINSMMNMFGAMGKGQQKAESVEKDFTFSNTGETETIGGYSASKFVFQTEGEENQKAVIWMTRDININWGMLAEPWGDSISFLTSEALPTDLVFQEGWLPLRATFYEDGQISGGMSAQVKTTDLAQSMVQLPPDVQVRSLSEYLFQRMRQQQ